MKENDSIWVTKFTFDNLKINGWKDNTPKTNFKLVEESLRNFSIKVLKDWDKYDEDYYKYRLDELLDILNNSLFTAEEKRAFFNQYSHCIIYLIGRIRNQKEQIHWEETELDKNVEFIKKDNDIESVKTKKGLQSYQIPTEMIKEYKKSFLK